METVILAWASRKRHIFVDGALLCEKQHKSAGYSPKGGVDGVSISLVSGGHRKTHPVPAKDVISWGDWGFSFNDTKIKITDPETGHKI